METKRPSDSAFYTLPNVNMSDRSLQPGEKIYREPSPRPAMITRSERDTNNRREEYQWKKSESEKTRYKDVDTPARSYEGHRGDSPRPRDRRNENDRNRNGKLLSNVGREPEHDGGRGMMKDHPFPRDRKSPDPDRQTMSIPERGDRKEERRQRDRPTRAGADERERERERQRDDFRDEVRSRGKDEAKRGYTEDEKVRQRERYQGSNTQYQDGRREWADSRDMKGRSERDIDERELRRERGRDRANEELTYQHRRSEGDSMGKMARERGRDKQGYREEDRQRQRDKEVDRSKRKGARDDRDRYRDIDPRAARSADREEERWKQGGGDLKSRREEDRYREYEKSRDEEREENSGRGYRTGGSSPSPNKIPPRVPPRVQSSGEWSSDGETRYRRERDNYSKEDSRREGTVEKERGRNAERNQIKGKQQGNKGDMAGSVLEQSRMWLEPRKGKNSKEFVDEEMHIRQKEQGIEDEMSMEKQGDWGRDGQHVKEEPDERHLDQRSYKERHIGRTECKDDAERKSGSVSVDGEEYDRDGGIEGIRQQDKEGKTVADNTEMSDGEEAGGQDYWQQTMSKGGSETVWKQDRGRITSGEENFEAVFSGGEDESKDCQAYWSGGSPSAIGRKRDDRTDEEGIEGKSGTTDEEEEGREAKPKYNFCAVGQTHPCSKNSGTSPSQNDEMGGDERDETNLETRRHCSDGITAQPQDDLQQTPSKTDENPDISNQDTESERRRSEREEMTNIKVRASSELQEPGEEMRNKLAQPYTEMGTVKRDLQTERLLKEWRERNKGLAEPGNEQTISNSSSPDYFFPVDLDGLQPILDQLTTEAMSPEEVEAIRVRMSGEWSMSDQLKRRSQAPHLKWAKDVVREILGQSEEEPSTEAQQGEVVKQPEISDNTQNEKSVEGASEVPLNLTTDEHSDPELDEMELLKEEEEEGERLRDDDGSKSWGEPELKKVLERRKRNSKFFHGQLYQQYNEAAQNLEILCQARSVLDPSVSPIPSPTRTRRPLPPLPPVPHPHSLFHTGSLPSNRTLPVPEYTKSGRRRLSSALSQSSTLWRDLPGVRNSAELEELTEDQRRLQEVRFEVLTSEASYCRSLDIVVDHFVKSQELGSLLTAQDKSWLFSRLQDVRTISHSFLAKLEEWLELDVLHFTVCDIIARHCQRFRTVYVPYLTNQSYQDATYQRLMNENPGFKQIVEKLEKSSVCQRLPLRSFLVLPFQRITRLKLLVQNIVKRTTPGTPEAKQAIKALKQLEKLIQESNDSISQMKNIESLVNLSGKVDFECKTLPLVKQHRKVVREGPVTQLMDFFLKGTERERSVYLHLFNDYLVVSLPKEGGRFTVIDHCPVSELRVENYRIKLHSVQKNAFKLTMGNKYLLLRTDTQSDKLRWISAISQHDEVDFSAAQDMEQMQCIRTFVAQQPDELSLEKAEIILVHQESDNWVEGTKLADRHRGWMPQSHLETISNPRVKNRNLTDALKLMTATVDV
ncbi:uncharacterized protein arhgef5 isoform 2-T2 [Pholidichthys leucotaenia]